MPRKSMATVRKCNTTVILRHRPPTQKPASFSIERFMAAGRERKDAMGKNISGYLIARKELSNEDIGATRGTVVQDIWSGTGLAIIDSAQNKCGGGLLINDSKIGIYFPGRPHLGMRSFMSVSSALVTTTESLDRSPSSRINIAHGANNVFRVISVSLLPPALADSYFFRDQGALTQARRFLKWLC